MQTFYKRLLQKRETLSLLEKQVLEYILSHPEKIIQMNLSQVSKETFVSTATISRTCKQLGYAGFQELKYTLSQYVKTEKQQLPLSFSSITGIEEMAERIRVEVDQTLSHLNKENLSKVHEDNEAKTILASLSELGIKLYEINIEEDIQAVFKQGGKR
ncbi:MAG: hypothetical protein RSB44_02995, partial [Carnobacterium sp.]